MDKRRSPLALLILAALLCALASLSGLAGARAASGPGNGSAPRTAPALPPLPKLPAFTAPALPPLPKSETVGPRAGAAVGNAYIPPPALAGGPARAGVHPLLGTSLSCTVTLTSDSNPTVIGELRYCINLINSASGATANTISFAIGTSGSAQTILVGQNGNGALPAITVPVLVDGWSQGGGGYTGPPLIEVQGTGLATSGLGLTLNPPSGVSATVQGLRVDTFLAGIFFDSGSNDLAQGNVVTASTDTTSPTSLGIIMDGTTSSTIGGITAAARNVVAGYRFGLSAVSASGTIIEGNYAGTDTTGATADANVFGILVQDSTSTTVGAGNLASGNGTGIYLLRGSGNSVIGNIIGLDATGTATLPNTGDGILVQATTGNTIGGLTSAARNIISGNADSGVDITDSGTNANTVEGNYIGTDVTGTTALANKIEGVLIQNGAQANTIGGTVVGARNVISGNGGFLGVSTGDNLLITNTGTNNNLVQGNYIGTNAAGTAIISGQGYAGAHIGNGAANTTIGGVTSTPGAAPGNVIAGNAIGVEIRDSGTTGTSVAGNLIGTDVTGAIALANTYGVALIAGAQSNSIGGATAAARNIISGNGINVLISDSGTNTNTVEGNYIGTDVTGAIALGGGQGVVIQNGAQSNTIGGTATGDGNVISGNTFANVNMGSPGTNDNVVAGNLIGTDPTGSTLVGTATDGVVIQFGGQNNTIGGTAAGAGNVIAGASAVGLTIAGTASGAQTTGNLVEGNFIGTNSASATGLGNGHGVMIQLSATGNTIGGTATGAGNVISGNTGYGVLLTDVGTNANTVLGNIIGLTVAGTAKLANFAGVVIQNGAQNNIIGGANAGAANTISGNAADGIDISGTSSSPQTSGNLVEGNFIGTTSSSATGLGNTHYGVAITTGANGNTIGGADTSGGTLGNTIDQNVVGVIFFGTASGPQTSGNLVEGNFIGTDSANHTGLGNRSSGVGITSGASGNTIGGANTSGTTLGNTIDRNANGVVITDTGTSGNLVEGNFIGTNATSVTGLGNTTDGVVIQNGATSNTIGGSTTASRNIISGNSTDGVDITDSGTSNNTVSGNYIGTDTTGTIQLANGTGVIVRTGATGNTIGGATVPDRNLISGNTGDGVRLADAGTSANTIAGNDIGLSGTRSSLGNGSAGVFLSKGSTNNIVGGTAMGAGNTIAFNTGAGVVVGASAADSATVADAIEMNNIHDNGGLGIDLGNDGVTANHAVSPSAGPNDFQNYPVLVGAISTGSQVRPAGTLTSTANTTFRVEYFANTACDPSGNGEGQTFVGFENVTTNGSGTAALTTFTAGSPVPTGSYLTTTATSTTGAHANDTSEFSKCQVVTGSATHFTVTAPSSADAGVPFQVTVTALDQNNNVVTGYSGTVHFTSSDPNAVLPADYTFVPATDQGVHTFTVTLETAGTQTITVTDTTNPSITGTATVTVGACTVFANVFGPGSARLGLASVGPSVPPRIAFQDGANLILIRSADIGSLVCANVGTPGATATLHATLGSGDMIRGLFKAGDQFTVTVGNELVNGHWQPYATETDTRNGVVVLSVSQHNPTGKSKVTIIQTSTLHH